MAVEDSGDAGASLAQPGHRRSRELAAPRLVERWLLAVDLDVHGAVVVDA
jgi:hypothetical protein